MLKWLLPCFRSWRWWRRRKKESALFIMDDAWNTLSVLYDCTDKLISGTDDGSSSSSNTAHWYCFIFTWYKFLYVFIVPFSLVGSIKSGNVDVPVSVFFLLPFLTLPFFFPHKKQYIGWALRLTYSVNQFYLNEFYWMIDESFVHWNEFVDDTFYLNWTTYISRCKST